MVLFEHMVKAHQVLKYIDIYYEINFNGKYKSSHQIIIFIFYPCKKSLHQSYKQIYTSSIQLLSEKLSNMTYKVVSL